MEKIKLTINDIEIEATPGKTILQTVHEHKLDKIPTLCHDNRLEHFTSCYVCVVEVEGLNKMVPSCGTVIREGMKIKTNSDSVRSARKTALELLFSNHYADCIGPCKDSCPAGVDAQGYIALASIGKYREAVKLVKESNPLPLSIGRVCVRDCENACRRNMVDEPVACNYLKRYIADYEKHDKWAPELKPKKNKKVAIIGGGPAGLTCAYYLVKEGYSPVIFEKLPKLGGMLRYGIPEYRLPKDTLEEEIDWILDLGVEARTNIELGKDISIHDLMKEGFDSVFVGVGAHKASAMGLENEDKIKGVYGGIDFLREIETVGIPEMKGTVIIVGGGNTAIDAARTALRCGADSVKIVYRRGRTEMPAHHEEIEAAEKEGVDILFLTNPTRIISENNNLLGIECLKQQLVETKPGERPKPVPIEGSEFIIECNYLISAIGQKIDTAFINLDSECSLEKWGTVSVNKKTFQTSIPGVFAGGDVVTGPLTAVSSIGQGKRAAISIMDYLETGKVREKEDSFLSFRHRFGELAEREFAHFKKIERERQPEINIETRIHTFEEVEHAISLEQSMHECERCLECGCSEYYDCVFRKYAEEYRIDINDLLGEVKKYTVDKRHPFISLDPNKCINCGKCVRTCSEILKVAALGFVYRGFKSVVKPAMEKPLLETNCIACGNCIDVCPTGAISENFPFKILGTMPKTDHETVCAFCGVGCKVNFKTITNDIFYISNSTEEIQNSHNRGYLCSKGRFGHRYLMERNRVFNPIIRKNNLVYDVDYNEAYDFAEDKIKKIISEFGPESVAVFASPKLSNEEIYLIQKFTRTGLKTNNIASLSNLFRDKDLNGLNESFGITASSVSMESIDNADVIVVVNSNLSYEYLPLELKIKEAQKKGAKLVVINSTEVKLTRDADLWIDSKKGTNTLMLNALMKRCIEDNAVDGEFIKNRTTSFDDFLNSLKNANIDEAVELININANKLDELYTLLGNTSGNVIFIYNLDSTRERSVNDVKALGNYLLMTGRVEKENNGIIFLRDSSNSAGLQDLGVTPDYLPGYVGIGDTDSISAIGKKWNADLNLIFKTADIEQKLMRGEIKAALIFGEDPLADQTIRKYFSGLELLLVCDAFNTPTLLEADIVLPASTHIEQSGTFTRCDHTIQYAAGIIEGPIEKNNIEIISGLAKRFGSGFNFENDKDVDKEIKKISRLHNKINPGDSWIKAVPDDLKKEKMKFAVYEIDLSTFGTAKHAIDFPENYYISNIKMQLV